MKIDRIGIARVKLKLRDSVRQRSRTWWSAENGPPGGVTHSQQQLLSIGAPERVADRLALEPGEVLPVAEIVDPELGPLCGQHRRRQPAPVPAQVVALEIGCLHGQWHGFSPGSEAHHSADGRIQARGVEQGTVGRDIVLRLTDGFAPYPGE